MTVITCPHCDVRSTTTLRDQTRGKSTTFQTYQCDNCGELILFIIRGEKADQYPTRIPKLDKSIPESGK